MAPKTVSFGDLYAKSSKERNRTTTAFPITPLPPASSSNATTPGFKPLVAEETPLDLESTLPPSTSPEDDDKTLEVVPENSDNTPSSSSLLDSSNTLGASTPDIASSPPTTNDSFPELESPPPIVVPDDAEIDSSTTLPQPIPSETTTAVEVPPPPAPPPAGATIPSAVVEQPPPPPPTEAIIPSAVVEPPPPPLPTTEATIPSATAMEAPTLPLPSSQPIPPSSSSLQTSTVTMPIVVSPPVPPLLPSSALSPSTDEINQQINDVTPATAEDRLKSLGVVSPQIPGVNVLPDGRTVIVSQRQYISLHEISSICKSALDAPDFLPSLAAARASVKNVMRDRSASSLDELKRRLSTLAAQQRLDVCDASAAADLQTALSNINNLSEAQTQLAAASATVARTQKALEAAESAANDARTEYQRLQDSTNRTQENSSIAISQQLPRIYKSLKKWEALASSSASGPQ